jgi:hypothetical protein
MKKMTNREGQVKGITNRQTAEGHKRRKEGVEPSEPNYEGFNLLGDYLQNDISRARNQARSCVYLVAFNMTAESLWIRRTPIQYRKS